MTPERRAAWTAQEPPPDFADRTVAALLRERARARPHTSKRWMAGVLIAAVLVAGAAFGLTGVVGRPRPDPATPPAPVRVEVSHDGCASCRAAPPVDRVEAPPAPSKDPVRRIPRREATLPPSSVDAGTSTGVKLPRCDCSFDQVICTCY
jgi:hypothetical protein